MPSGAAYVGPDDTVLLEPQSVEAPAGTPVVSTPELLSYRDMVLVVRAESAGEVFLGAGNPVDVESVVADVPHFRLTGIDRDALLGKTTTVDEAEPLPDLGAMTGWTESSVGAGPQQIAIDLDGTPTRLLAASTDEEPFTLQFGVRLDGLFWTLLAVAGVGAALSLLAVLLHRRARRERSAEKPGETAAPTLRTEEPARPLARTAALLIPALVLSGCAWIPQQVETTTPTTVAMTEDELEPALEDYDRRNNAAIKAASPPEFDAAAWLDVHSGPLLNQTTYSTVLDDLLRSKERGKRVIHEPVEVYSPTFTTYPVWTLVTSRTSDPGEDEVNLSVFTQESAAAPWMRRTTAAVSEADLPAATDPQPAPNGGREAEVLVDRLGAFLQGRRVPGLQVDRNAREFRRDITDPKRREDTVRGYRLSILRTTEREDELRVVAVDGGRLAVAVRHVRLTYLANKGRELRWNPGYDQVNGRSAAGIHRDYNLIAVMSLPDDGVPQVLSTTLLDKRA
ncbi:hypothetical protein GCM10027425_11900 [Alteromonas gracilis]